MATEKNKNLKEGYVPSKKPVNPEEIGKKGYVPPPPPQKPPSKPGGRKNKE